MLIAHSNAFIFSIYSLFRYDIQHIVCDLKGLDIGGQHVIVTDNEPGHGIWDFPDVVEKYSIITACNCARLQRMTLLD